jgi:hypothetical protein
VGVWGWGDGVMRSVGYGAMGRWGDKYATYLLNH